MEVLRYLLDHSAEQVSVDDLINAVWGGKAINDSVVKQCIRDIRRALGDDKKPYDFIQTEGRSGYRFVRRVRRSPLPGSAATGIRQEVQDTIFERKEVLNTLPQALGHSQQGTSQVVMVTGEAGIGKTTVIEQFLRHLPGQDDIWLVQGHCVEHYGFGEPYRPLLEAIQQLRTGHSKRRLASLIRRIAPLCLLHLSSLTTAKERTALYQELAQVEPGRMVRELVTVFETLSEERLVVVVLEDLHWSDAATLDVIVALAKMRSAKLLVIGTYRPEEARIDDHPLHAAVDQLLVQNDCTLVELQALSMEAVLTYIKTRFPEHPVLLHLASVLHTRTGGNPYFLTEMLRYLTAYGIIDTQSGVSEAVLETAIPHQVQRLIERQFAQLTRDEQAIVEIASVIGEHFPTELAATVLNASQVKVEELAADLARNSRFLYPEMPMRWPDGTVTPCFRFRHMLQQQTVYHNLSLTKRTALHLRAAERLENGFGAQTVSIVAELTRHFAEGHDLQRAASYAYLAGQNAVSRSGYIESIRYFTKSLELVGQLGESSTRIDQEIQSLIALAQSVGVIEGFGAEKVAQAYSQMYILYDRTEEKLSLNYSFGLLNSFHIVRGELQIVEARCQHLRQIAEKRNDQTTHLRSVLSAGPALLHRGNLIEARAQLLEAVTNQISFMQNNYLSPIGFDHVMGCLAHLSWGLWMLGYPDQSLVRGHEAITLARQLTDPSTLAYSFLWMAITHLIRREAQATQEQAEAALQIANAQSFVFIQALGGFLRGWTLAEQGQLQVGSEQMREGLAAHMNTGAKLARPWWLALLAEVVAKIGQLEEAGKAIEEAHHIIAETGERSREAEVYRVEGELQLIKNPADTAKAEECFQRALAVARDQQAKSWELRTAISLARLWQQAGKEDEARQLLESVYEWFTEGFDTADLREARALLSGLSP